MTVVVTNCCMQCSTRMFSYACAAHMAGQVLLFTICWYVYHVQQSGVPVPPCIV